MFSPVFEIVYRSVHNNQHISVITPDLRKGYYVANVERETILYRGLYQEILVTLKRKITVVVLER